MQPPDRMRSVVAAALPSAFRPAERMSADTHAIRESGRGSAPRQRQSALAGERAAALVRPSPALGGWHRMRRPNGSGTIAGGQAAIWSYVASTAAGWRYRRCRRRGRSAAARPVPRRSGRRGDTAPPRASATATSAARWDVREGSPVRTARVPQPVLRDRRSVSASRRS